MSGTAAMQTLCFTVDDAGARLRLDAFLAARLPWRSRRWLVARLDGGAVRINGGVAKKARRVAVGDVVALEVPAAEAPPEDLGALPLRLLFEDADLVVVDKPAHLPVHPASTCLHRNLLSRLQHRYRAEIGDANDCPAVVHRLDRGTTGVIAFARRAELVPFYMGQFERRTVRKRYIAIVHGEPADEGVVELPLLVRPEASVVVDDAGKASRTAWRVLARAPGAAMIEVALHTGRKHQIRVHMAARGYPIVHDDLYGLVHERAAWPVPSAPALHAARLELDHTDGRRHVFEAAIPDTMRALWATLGG